MMATEQPVPEWHIEPHYCTGCPHQYHSIPCDECSCVTSCPGLVIIPEPHTPRMPLLWWNDIGEPDCA